MKLRGIEDTVRAAVALALLCAATQAVAVPITNPAGFTATMTVIDYSSSPVGPIAGGTSVTTQYGLLGVTHDGSTTTPPGPPGMSSASGLPGLESPAGDPDLSLPIHISFAVAVNQVGAFFLIGIPSDSITISALRADSSIIESFVVSPGSMRLGPFGFNEGFIGLSTSEAIAEVVFSPSTNAFVIDDLHFGAASIPEPASIALIMLGGLAGLGFARRRPAV